MKKVNKDTFIKGALVSTVCIILAKFLGVIYVIPFKAIIGDKGGALYSYAYNIYAIFLSISTVGIPMAISKLVSEYYSLGYKKAAQRSYHIALVVTTCFAILSTVMLLLFAMPFARMIKGDISGGNSLNDIAYVIKISASAILFTTILSVIRGYLQGQKYIKHPSISQVVEQFIRIIIIIGGSIVFMKLYGVKRAVGIAVFGATLGSIAALIYLIVIHYKDISLKYEKETSEEEKTITNKVILKRIITYAIPLVIMSVLASLYIMVDFATVIKTLVNKLGFSIKNAEYIMSSISTWGAKLNVIVTSISTGISVSLLPNLTSDFAVLNYPALRKKIYQTTIALVVVVLPMVFGLSVISKYVWTFFYGYNELGIKVFRFSIFMAFFQSLFNNTLIIMQALNRYKKLYLSLVAGLLTKIVLNIPLMLVFNLIHISPFYGSILATILGISFSLFICFHDLKVNFKVKTKKMILIATISLISSIIMYAVVFFIMKFINIHTNSRFIALLLTIIYSFVGAFIYGFFLYITGVLKYLITYLGLKKNHTRDSK